MSAEVPNPIHTAEENNDGSEELEMRHYPNARHDVSSLLFKGRGSVGRVVEAVIRPMALEANVPTKRASPVQVGNVVTVDACPPPSRHLTVAKGIPLAQQVRAPKTCE